VKLDDIENLWTSLFAVEKGLHLRDKSKFGDRKLIVFLFIFLFCIVFVRRQFQKFRVISTFVLRVSRKTVISE
jgi:hypothetical protein